MASLRDPARFARIRALFEQLVEIPAQQRVEAIERLEPDSEIRARVLSMLGRESAQLGVEHAIIGLLGSLAGPQVQSGDVLGAWTLRRKLGEGGMGAVFLASRSDGNFAQTVAIKVLRGAGSAVAPGISGARAANFGGAGAPQYRAAVRWRHHPQRSALFGDGTCRWRAD